MPMVGLVMRVNSFSRISFFVLLDVSAQAFDRGIPPGRNLFQGSASFRQLARSELPEALAAETKATRQPSLFQSEQMLGNGLTRYRRAFGETCDGERYPTAKPGDDPQSRFVAKRRENRGCVYEPGGGQTSSWCHILSRGLGPQAQGTSRSTSPGGSIPRHCRQMPSHAAPAECDRSRTR